MLLWSVDMNHFKGVHGGRETAQFAEFAVRNIPLHPLDTHTHTQSLTVLVTPVPIRSTNDFNALENPLEDDPWEILPWRQTHSETRV